MEPQDRTGPPDPAQAMAIGDQNNAARKRLTWKSIFGRSQAAMRDRPDEACSSDTEAGAYKSRAKWTMGIMNDRETDEVPGSVLLLSKASEYNEPLGLRNAPARNSASSLPSPYRSDSRRRSSSSRRFQAPEIKRTSDGKIILEPQPDQSLNDPLNWKVWRRDVALLSLGFYCMIGGGMTPVLAAGFNEIAAQFHTTEARVALTTGMYMLGLGMGSVVLSPTAILFGKRPVYLVAAICFILTSMWCALSPDLTSLIVARVFMGLAVSSVECLPSASVAEIFFLHEKAYRLGIYTLLLLGGKNLMPLISAAIIQTLGWRWVFWVICMVVGFCWVLLFFFVPETFWDRTPRPKAHGRRRSRSRSLHLFRTHSSITEKNSNREPTQADLSQKAPAGGPTSTSAEPRHAHFEESVSAPTPQPGQSRENGTDPSTEKLLSLTRSNNSLPPDVRQIDYFNVRSIQDTLSEGADHDPPLSPRSDMEGPFSPLEVKPPNAYTEHLQQQPPRTFLQQLKPWTGRLRKDNWFRVAARPFILFAYPAILWSALVYSLSIGWLIVLSESVAHIYEDSNSYGFTPLQAGLVYISPFIGGIIGTAVAGKVSDLIVRFLARRNGGVYEPEFRLVMAIPITISTVIGLMGYGWSADEHDAWIVPTIFFGIISFGCSLGSTTSITFAVDSYRQYAGEALVTLNWSKNILHGMVFSLFFNNWLDADGSKVTFIAIGCMQLACLATTVPMYIWGKRARMWTVRRNLMEKF